MADVLVGVEAPLARHPQAEVVTLLERIRAAVEGKGLLAVRYGPNKVTATGAFAIQASIGIVDAHWTCESLASPIRRLVLRRLAEGPCTFMQAITASRLADTSKIAIHLRKLTQGGLIAHAARQRYRPTPRGEGAARVLRSVYDLDSPDGIGNLSFQSMSRASARP